MKKLLLIRKSLVFLSTTLFCFFTLNLFGQASYDNNGVTGGGSKNITVPAGHNRLLVVHASTFGNGRSASFKGMAMTEIVSSNAGGWSGRSTIWVLPLGSGCEINGNVSVNNSGGGPAKRLWAGSFQHVNQTTPAPDWGSAAVPGGNSTTNIGGLTNIAGMDLLLDGLIVGDNGCSPPAPSAQGGGTVLYNQTFSSNCVQSAARLKAGPGGNASVSWSVSLGWRKPHVAIVISGITANNTPIEDNEAPVANCKDVTVTLDASGNGSTTANAVDNGSTDNCTIASRVLSTTAFTCSDVGNNTVTLTITDGGSNTSNCTAIVTVESNNTPTAICQNVTVQLDASGNGTTTASTVDNGSTTSCNAPSLSLSKTSFNCSNLGNNSVVLTATDASNSSTSSCTATVVVQDNIAPAALCQNATVQLDANGNGSLATSAVNNGSNDACGISNTSLNITSFNCSNVGNNNTVILTVSDNNSNSNSCSSTITVEDNVDPTAICQNITVQLDPNGNGTITASQVNNGSSDACGIASTTVNISNFNCSQAISNVTLTVTDNNSNVSTCSATITTEDNIAPTALCKDATIYLDEGGNAELSAADIDNGSNDNCSIVSSVVSTSSFDCSKVGTHSIHLIVMDANSNTSSCSAKVAVVDNIAPTVTCQDATVQLDANGSGSITFAGVTSTPEDNCSVNSTNVTPNSFDCNHVGGQTVTVTVTDDNSNTTTCTANVSVEDNIAPQPICLNPTITFNGESEIALQIAQVWDEINSTDNCDFVSFVSMSPIQVYCGQIGSTIPVLVNVEDSNGNPAQCTAMVTVDGLPCGWIEDPDGINCSGGNDANFDPNTGNFVITSEGCYDTGGYYSNSDSHGFVSTELCGDGEIVAQITQVLGNGWAGIGMREGTGASDRMLQISIDGNALSKRELRASPGATAFNHVFQTQGKIWLRLTRSGNTFSAYNSLDGINWSTVFVTNMNMPDCIQVGLFTENASQSGIVTATFEQVSFGTNNNAPLFAPVPNSSDEQFQAFQPEANVYPNPTTGKTFINLEAYLGLKTHIRVFNSTGKLLETTDLGEVQVPTHTLNLGQYQNGLYLIQIQAEGYKNLTKKLTLTE